ncbi:MAG TPA: FkbM family methyltransferase, partial [Gallionella sp.]|nr:FkbM family methyltransferase [Gallionella sp.]
MFPQYVGVLRTSGLGETMRELIKRHIRNSGIEPYARWLVKRSRGIKMRFDLVKNEIYDRQATEIIQRVLATDSNCLDVGCHQGQFLKEFVHHAPAGRHFAFEPIPRLAERLQQSFPGVEVFPYALSDKSGEATFYVIPDSPALSGLNAREFVARDKARQEITVQVRRLDDIIPRDLKIDLVKIDVEGAEGPVILGALETIRRNRPYIILEHGDTSSKAFGFSSSQIYDLVTAQCGLSLSLLTSWLRKGAPLSKR